jgi:hypothetical protein
MYLKVFKIKKIIKNLNLINLKLLKKIQDSEYYHSDFYID